MPIRMQPSKFGQSEVPDIQHFTQAAALTVLRGAVVTYNTSTDVIDEHGGGATVTGVLGVALCDVAAGVSDDPAGDLPVAKAYDQVFAAQVVAGGVDKDVVLTDLSSLAIGDTYGIIKNTAGEWLVDYSDTTHVVLTIQRIDDDLDLVWFKFISTAIQVL